MNDAVLRAIFFVGSFVIILLIAIILLCGLYYFGLFAKFEVEERKKHLFNRPKIIAYKSFAIDYQHGPREMKRIRRLAPNSESLIIYYNDPETIDEIENHGFAAGVILQDCGDRAKMNELVNRLEAAQCRFFRLPGASPGDSTSMVHSVFPITHRFPVDIAWIMIRGYIKRQGLNAHPNIELYRKYCVHFYVPCENNDRYYVPEFKSQNHQFGSHKYSDLVDDDGNLRETGKENVLETIQEDEPGVVLGNLPIIDEEVSDGVKENVPITVIQNVSDVVIENVPEIAAENVTEIGFKKVTEIGDENVTEIGAENVTEIGAENVAEIELENVPHGNVQTSSL